MDRTVDTHSPHSTFRLSFSEEKFTISALEGCKSSGEEPSSFDCATRISCFVLRISSSKSFFVFQVTLPVFNAYYPTHHRPSTNFIVFLSFDTSSPTSPESIAADGFGKSQISINDVHHEACNPSWHDQDSIFSLVSAFGPKLTTRDQLALILFVQLSCYPSSITLFTTKKHFSLLVHLAHTLTRLDINDNNPFVVLLFWLDN